MFLIIYCSDHTLCWGIFPPFHPLPGEYRGLHNAHTAPSFKAKIRLKTVAILTAILMTYLG